MAGGSPIFVGRLLLCADAKGRHTDSLFLQVTRFWARGWGHSFAADDAEPSHHFAQESPQPCNLINLIASAYHSFFHAGLRFSRNELIPSFASKLSMRSFR